MKLPVRVEEDLKDSYAVYRLFDDDDVLLLNFHCCERYQPADVLKGAKEFADRVAKCINNFATLEAENARLKAALEIYADPKNWKDQFSTPIIGSVVFWDDDDTDKLLDGWEIAREALEAK